MSDIFKKSIFFEPFSCSFFEKIIVMFIFQAMEIEAAQSQ